MTYASSLGGQLRGLYVDALMLTRWTNSVKIEGLQPSLTKQQERRVILPSSCLIVVGTLYREWKYILVSGLQYVYKYLEYGIGAF